MKYSQTSILSVRILERNGCHSKIKVICRELNKEQRCGKGVGKSNEIMQNLRDKDGRAIATPSPEGTKKWEDTGNQKKSPIKRVTLR